jgi:glycosyltransferase involved in cell wall biosynthesis
MRIAQVCPLYETVPPKFYGGTERVVAHLCDALVDLGHDVTLFAAQASRTRAALVASRQPAIRLDSSAYRSDLAAHLSLLHEARERSDEFDVLHFHVDMLHFPMFEGCAEKSVTTLHGRLDVKDLAAVYERWPGFGLVAISESQRRALPRASWLATVAHGVTRELFRFRERPKEGYLAFLGRISPEKRPDRAVRLAERAGVHLKMAAKVDAADEAYFNQVLRPLLASSTVDFVGEIGDTRKSAFLGNARALLFPIDWPEPFGLVMIEAMACGTPVIAWNRGSVAEIVEDGVTGFIVDSEDEALAAISRIGSLDRRRVRQVFEERFTGDVMARNYLRVYERLLDAENPPGLCRPATENADERAGGAWRAPGIAASLHPEGRRHFPAGRCPG